MIKLFAITVCFTILSTKLFAQISFDSLLISNQKLKLDSISQIVNKQASNIKCVDCKYLNKVATPKKNFEGEADFLFLLDEAGNIIDISILQFQSYIKMNDHVRVLDYIIFADGSKIGFNKEKIDEHQLNSDSKMIIDYLFAIIDSKKISFFISSPNTTNVAHRNVKFGN